MLSRNNANRNRWQFLMLDDNDEAIAAYGDDFTWSVQWDRVIDQSYRPPTKGDAAIGAICRLLLAGRDNFLTTPWPDSPPTIDTAGITIGGSAFVPVIDVRFIVRGFTGVVAAVGADGKWSVNWAEIPETLTRCCDDGEIERHGVSLLALHGMCVLLLAAKDNFITYPFPASSLQG